MDLADYFEFLADAHLASEEQDDFDLVSGNAESEAIWAALCAKHQERQRALITFVTNHSAELLAFFDGKAPADG